MIDLFPKVFRLIDWLLILDKNGEWFVSFPQATCPMDLSYFPMDSQLCTLEVSPTFETIFHQNKFFTTD